MNDNIVDRALRNEPEIGPSLGFTDRVMRSVRREAAGQPAIPFPWQRIAVGLGAAVALTVASALTSAPPETVAAPPEHLAGAAAWLTTTLAASLGLAWWSLRFAGR